MAGRRDSTQLDTLHISPAVSRRGSVMRASFDSGLQIPVDNKGRRRSSQM
jgi:hypothetical protein